ncbi:MAG: DnaA regulatory inactivator Hda [Gammaproteobacteria bacterium]|nr:DnaA regulatory inactivator Hda [Gammaproteobacteria bacterium]
MSQLALPLQLEDHAVFESFWPAGNETLVAFLLDLAATQRGPGCWLWGNTATGKSHLLQAVCERLGDRSVYLPMRDLQSTDPAIIDGLAAREFVCLDDIHSVAGLPEWEPALFSLYNSISDAKSVLIVSADTSPRDSAFELPDLKSRLSLLPAFHLRSMPEEERQKALQLRASHRGLELPDDTARYLIARSKRDMASLYALLDRLDAEALVAKRRLTVPFVKGVIGF